jgi:hypothetical protein
MSVADNLRYVNREIAAALDRRRERFSAAGRNCVSGDIVEVAAASKYVGAETIIDAYDAGLRIFGENKIQDLKSKYDYIKSSRPDILNDLQFHVIGHLQTNKTRDAILCSNMIQSVDSIKLARKINEQCEKNNKNIGVLIEIKTSAEESKTGIEIRDAMELAAEIKSLDRLELRGVMTMAVFSDNADEVRACFVKAYDFFETLKNKYGDNCRCLSMGMSDDFPLAVECGANMIRAGRILFK